MSVKFSDHLQSVLDNNFTCEININFPEDIARKNGCVSHENIPAHSLTCPVECISYVDYALLSFTAAVINSFNESKPSQELRANASFEFLLSTPKNGRTEIIKLTGMDALVKQYFDSHAVVLTSNVPNRLSPSLPNLFTTSVMLQLPRKIANNNRLGLAATVEKQSLVCPSSVAKQKEFAVCNIIQGIQEALAKHRNKITSEVANNLSIDIILSGAKTEKWYRIKSLSKLEQDLVRRLELEPSAALQRLVVSPNFDEGISGMFSR